jgi:diguanylate cyclase (GGDEF)-like protein/PAS domain S-box-containing protein
MMDDETKPQKALADELESLREQIARLQSLVLQYRDGKSLPANESELATRNEQHRKSCFLEDGVLGMALVDNQFGVVKANKALCRLLGYTKQEIKSLHFQQFVQQQSHCLQLVRQVLDGLLPYSKTEEQFLKKSGEIFWAQCAVSLVSNTEEYRGCCLAIIEDISDRKQAEAALQSEKLLLERIINSSVDGIFAFDRNCFLTVWSPGIERIFGISATKTLGKHAFAVCPFLKELGEDANFKAALEGKNVISRDKPYTVPGTVRQGYFEGCYGPIYSAYDGDVIGGLAVVRDVTERKLAEVNKHASEEQYRELFENAYDLVYTHDLTGRITSINKATERITGYARGEALQMRFNQWVAPEFQPIARRMLDRQIVGEVPKTQEIEIIAKDSSRIVLEVSTRLIFQEGRAVGIQGIARDITERKKSEEALQQSKQKLESWVEELEQRTHEMTLLNEMGDILRACLTTEEVYEVVVRVAQEIFPVQGGALYVIGPSRNIVESVATWGDISQLEHTFTPDECWALRRGRVYWIEDTRVGLLCKHLQTPPPRGYLCVPMMAQSEAVGILHLMQPKDVQMPEAKQRLAMAMAEHVAMALSNLRLHETLRTQSIRDSLTGLFNRSFMEESLELELRRAIRTQHPLSVIMLALDGFRQVVEKHGALAGDSVLRSIGMLLQSNVRKGDIACRFGSETFVLILPQSSFEISRQRAESLRDLARSLQIKNQSERDINITLSVGLAVFPGHGQTVESLLRSTEAALNRAKSSGGDIVVVAS